MVDNRRKSPRVQLAVTAEIEYAGETHVGATRDLSTGGVSITLEGAPNEGDVLNVALILTEDGIEHADEDPLEACAAVIWSAPTDSGTTMIGLRFKDLSQAQTVQLERFLKAVRH